MYACVCVCVCVCGVLQFDAVFGPATPQHTVFTDVARLLQSAVDGYNVSIISYGQVGVAGLALSLACIPVRASSLALFRHLFVCLFVWIVSILV